MTMVGWHNVSPNVSPTSNQLGIFCHNISLFIRVGEFVAINVGENRQLLGRVIDISQTRNYDILHYFPDTAHYIGPFLKLNHFNVIKENLDARRCIPQLNPDEVGQVVKNEFLLRQAEVYQSNINSWHSASLVADLIFVFHEAKIKDGTYGMCIGMSNCYFIRYRYDPAEKMVMSVDVNNFVSFAPSSSSIRVWHLLCHTNKEVCRLLTSHSDNRHDSTSFPVSDDAWQFIYKKIKSAQKDTLLRQRTRLLIMPNLSRCVMVDRNVRISYARIDQVADLASLRLCFGEVFGVGIPQRPHRPSPTNQTTYSRRGDNVNILHLSDDNEMEDGENPKFRERTAARGIDFYYDEAAGTLRLRIRYSRIAICDEVVKQVFPAAGIRLEDDEETTTMTMVQQDEDE
jgi:hypothetical protein